MAKTLNFNRPQLEELRNVYIERSDIWVKKMARKVGCFGDVLGPLAEPRADYREYMVRNTW